MLVESEFRDFIGPDCLKLPQIVDEDTDLAVYTSVILAVYKRLNWDAWCYDKPAEIVEAAFSESSNIFAVETANLAWENLKDCGVLVEAPVFNSDSDVAYRIDLDALSLLDGLDRPKRRRGWERRKTKEDWDRENNRSEVEKTARLFISRPNAIFEFMCERRPACDWTLFKIWNAFRTIHRFRDAAATALSSADRNCLEEFETQVEWMLYVSSRRAGVADGGLTMHLIDDAFGRGDLNGIRYFSSSMHLLDREDDLNRPPTDEEQRSCTGFYEMGERVCKDQWFSIPNSHVWRESGKEPPFPFGMSRHEWHDWSRNGQCERLNDFRDFSAYDRLVNWERFIARFREVCNQVANWYGVGEDEFLAEEPADPRPLFRQIEMAFDRFAYVLDQMGRGDEKHALPVPDKDLSDEKTKLPPNWIGKITWTIEPTSDQSQVTGSETESTFVAGKLTPEIPENGTKSQSEKNVPRDKIGDIRKLLGCETREVVQFAQLRLNVNNNEKSDRELFSIVADENGSTFAAVKKAVQRAKKKTV